MRSDRLSHPPPSNADAGRDTDSTDGASRHAPLRPLDAFVFSSGLAATIGAALSTITSLALDAPRAGHWAFIAAAGTFIIYSLDRLRDLERDRSTAPLRTRFVDRNRRPLQAGAAIVTLALAVALWQSPPSIIALCASIGTVGLLHRRLKRNAAWKTVYVSLAWVAACVGIPWLASGRDAPAAWIAGILFATLLANLIASNLRDDEAALFGGDRRILLRLARGIIVVAIGCSIAAPASLRPIVWVPVWEALALATFRPSERYGHFAIDGALLVGAVAAGIQFGL